MHDFFLINHGKSGVLGSFAAQEPLALRRGDLALVQSLRGLEVGTVLGPASVRQSRLLGAQSSGTLVRPIGVGDRATLERLREREQNLFTAGQTLAVELAPSLVVLDAELFFDGRHALMQVLGGAALDVSDFVERLQSVFDLEVKLENLAAMTPDAEDEHHEGGCGKPDCGKTEGGGGCSSCGTGGGCSSCGSASAAAVDLSPYFAHLRAAMEEGQRTSLL